MSVGVFLWVLDLSELSKSISVSSTFHRTSTDQYILLESASYTAPPKKAKVATKKRVENDWRESATGQLTPAPRNPEEGELIDDEGNEISLSEYWNKEEEMPFIEILEDEEAAYDDAIEDEENVVVDEDGMENLSDENQVRFKEIRWKEVGENFGRYDRFGTSRATYFRNEKKRKLLKESGEAVGQKSILAYYQHSKNVSGEDEATDGEMNIAELIAGSEVGVNVNSINSNVEMTPEVAIKKLLAADAAGCDAMSTR